MNLRNNVSDRRLTSEESRILHKLIKSPGIVDRETKKQKMEKGRVEIRSKSGEVETQVYLEDIEGMDFSKVGGLEDLKERLRKDLIYPLKHRDLSDYYKQCIESGTLLYGPPGCGKTYVTKALAGEAKVKLINANLGHIIEGYVGQTEKNIFNIFQFARDLQEPVIVFLDEVDAISRQREKTSTVFYHGIINTLLSEMDGVSKNDNLLVIGATNSHWLLDPAILRPGRFSNMMFIPPPVLEGRVSIFEIYLNDLPLGDDVDVEKLAEKTEFFSGADIKYVCDKAAEVPWLEAISGKEKRRICMDDFLQALECTRPSCLAWTKMVSGYFDDYQLDKELYWELWDFIREHQGEIPGL